MPRLCRGYAVSQSWIVSPAEIALAASSAIMPAAKGREAPGADKEFALGSDRGPREGQWGSSAA